ncbi:MAG: hypothetical protein RR561_07460 [Peptostreptococcus sp.]|uniref:hypothetical protein n=1 Tax=Peptostreptococcus sp. TaxID=1262 RepID=UPI002FC6D923
MAKEALLKVVEAEEKAEQLIKTAKSESRDLIALSEKRSRNLLDDATIKAKVECDRLRSKAEDDMKEELDAISRASEEKCKSITDIPQDRFNEAKKILVERIVK